MRVSTSVAHELEDIGCKLLADLIHDRYGLVFDGARRDLLSYRLADRIEALKLETLTEYYDYLMHHPDRDAEYMEIVKHVTNGTTYFFRESYQFDLLIKHVLPLYLQKPREEPVRILSAGCSSGEEAWSMAISLHDAFESCPVPQWSIDACDINPLRIARARQGEYEEKSLRECSPDIVDRCFDRLGDRYRLKDTYREGVRFFEANLTTGSSYPWKPYDIIFCRNVLIYFSDAAFAKTVERFARRLTGQGHLFLGHSESLIQRSSDFEPVCLEEKIIYRKRQR